MKFYQQLPFVPNRPLHRKMRCFGKYLHRKGAGILDILFVDAPRDITIENHSIVLPPMAGFSLEIPGENG